MLTFFCLTFTINNYDLSKRNDPMKKSTLVLNTIITLTMMIIAAAPVFAGTTSWSGTLQNPDPSVAHVGNGCFGVSSYVEWYDTQVFSVDTTGTYTITMTAMTGSATPDGFYALYATAFNPANVIGNCVATDDDGGGGLVPKMTVSLQAGQTYVLVTTQCCDGTDAGQEIGYTNEIAGPGNIFLPGAATACAYPLPSGLTQGVITQTTSAFWAANSSATTNVVLPVGSHWWILGTSGDYVNLWITCQGTPVWVPASTVG